MADFSQLIYGTAQNVAQGAGEGLVDVALQAENLQHKRALLQQQQEQIKQAKYEKMTGLLETAAKMDDKSKKLFLGKDGAFRKLRDNMGMAEAVPDSGLDFMIATPENFLKAQGLIHNYRSRGGDPAGVWADITNPMKYPDIQPYYEDLNKQLEDAQKGRESIVRGEGTQRRSDRKSLRDLHKDFEFAIKDVKGAATSAARIDHLLMQNTPAAMQTIKIELNKLAGQAANSISNADLRGTSGDPSIAARVEQNLQTFAKGGFTKENIAQLREIAQVYKRTAADKVRREADRSVDEGSTYGFDEKLVRKNLSLEKTLKELEGNDKKTIEVDGVTYDIDKAKDIAEKNPKHPKTKRILDAIKAAGGQ